MEKEGGGVREAAGAMGSLPCLRVQREKGGEEEEEEREEEE